MKNSLIIKVFIYHKPSINYHQFSTGNISSSIPFLHQTTLIKYFDSQTNLQDLLETNIRQRGDVGGSAKKVGLRIKELERIYGVREGRPEKLPKVSEVNQLDIADMIGISVDTLQNYKKLTEMIPELEELADN